MGSFVSSTASQESPSDIIDRIFACPVCFEKYKTQIILCQSGHSVCEGCSKRIKKCPICDANYGKIRNYALEDLAMEIKKSNTTPEKIVNDVLYAAEARAIAESKKDGIQQNVTRQNVNEQSVIQQNANQQNPNQQNANNFISCPICNCFTVFPKTELRDHLYAKHLGYVHCINVHNERSNFNFKIYAPQLACKSYYALDTNLGIFFLIFRIDKQPQSLLVTVWIQGICSYEEAYKFYTYFNIKVDNYWGEYNNYVNGAEVNASDIVAQHICLRFNVPTGPAGTHKEFNINGYICTIESYRSGASRANLGNTSTQ